MRKLRSPHFKNPGRADLDAELAAASDALERFNRFVRTPGKTRDKVQVWSTTPPGGLFGAGERRVATYQGIPKRIGFSSPMVNDANLALCEGWGWGGGGIRQSWDAGLWRAISGKKPVVTFAHPDPKDFNARVARARKAGLAVVVKDGRAAVGARGEIGKVFDLAALGEDYRRAGLGWVADAMGGYAATRIEELLPAFALTADDADGFEKTLPTWLIGLLLGYPVWSTISLY